MSVTAPTATSVKVCPSCGARGEYSGFMRPCPACVKAAT